MSKRMKAIKAEVRKGCNDEEVVQKGPYTFARFLAVVAGAPYVGIGFSRCIPTDELAPGLGQTIAVGRAVHDIACQVRDRRDGDQVSSKGRVVATTRLLRG